MRKWKITIILKNGAMIRGMHNTTLTDVVEIMKEIMPNINTNNFSCLASGEKEGREVIFFAMSEVAAMRIEVME